MRGPPTVAQLLTPIMGGRDHPPLAHLEAAVWANPTISAAFRQHQLATPASDAA